MCKRLGRGRSIDNEEESSSPEETNCGEELSDNCTFGRVLKRAQTFIEGWMCPPNVHYLTRPWRCGSNHLDFNRCGAPTRSDAVEPGILHIAKIACLPRGGSPGGSSSTTCNGFVRWNRGLCRRRFPPLSNRRGSVSLHNNVGSDDLFLRLPRRDAGLWQPWRWRGWSFGDPGPASGCGRAGSSSARRVAGVSLRARRRASPLSRTAGTLRNARRSGGVRPRALCDARGAAGSAGRSAAARQVLSERCQAVVLSESPSLKHAVGLPAVVAGSGTGFAQNGRSLRDAINSHHCSKVVVAPFQIGRAANGGSRDEGDSIKV